MQQGMFLVPPLTRLGNNTKRKHNAAEHNIEREMTKTKQKVAVGSTRRLVHYCQLLDKNSLDISRYSEFFVYLLHDVWRNPEQCYGEPYWNHWFNL